MMQRVIYVRKEDAKKVESLGYKPYIGTERVHKYAFVVSKGQDPEKDLDGILYVESTLVCL